jgi:glycine C-acetyltransferase
VDDSHAVGVLGANGRGSHEHHNVMGRVDIITGTLGKALGGASGGYTAGRTEIIELLRQRSRPYLFSNSVAPVIVATSLVALDKLAGARKRLMENTRYFRAKIGIPGEHPIVPVMLGDAKLAGRMADRLLEKGVYVIAFSYPVVPKDKARIRVQISAAHTRQDLDLAVEAFASVKKEMGI